MWIDETEFFESFTYAIMRRVSVGPARISWESLTPRPGIRERYLPKPEATREVRFKRPANQEAKPVPPL